MTPEEYGIEAADVLIDEGFRLSDLDEGWWKQDVLDNLSLAFSMCSQDTYDEVELAFVSRVEDRLMTCHCGQPAMVDFMLCSDCRTVAETVPVRREPPRPLDFMPWLRAPCTTGGEWR
jgi:hypothetical protein